MNSQRLWLHSLSATPSSREHAARLARHHIRLVISENERRMAAIHARRGNKDKSGNPGRKSYRGVGAESSLSVRRPATRIPDPRCALRQNWSFSSLWSIAQNSSTRLSRRSGPENHRVDDTMVYCAERHARAFGASHPKAWEAYGKETGTKEDNQKTNGAQNPACAVTQCGAETQADARSLRLDHAHRVRQLRSSSHEGVVRDRLGLDVQAELSHAGW